MSGQREEILRRLDVQAEFEKWGVRIAAKAKPDAKGWLRCHSLYSEDKDPSASINVSGGPQRGIYHDFILRLSKSLFDIAAEAPGSGMMTGRDAYFYYAKLTGVRENNEPHRPKPTLADIEAFQKNLTPETIQFLKEKRGLTEESIKKFQVGWCTKRERNSIPVYDMTGLGPTLVNVRFHNSKKKPKTLNWAGCGEVRLWGLERLAKSPPGSAIIICEGELDSALAEQETGWVGVTSTNGAAAFQAEWVKHFRGHHVVLLYDSDLPGRHAVASLVLPAFKAAVEAGEVLSLKVVWLYEPPAEPDHKDLTDWIVKDGGSGARLKEIIQQTEPHDYPTPVSHLEPSIQLSSFEQVDRSEYAGKRVTVPLQVYGENTVAYHGVTRVVVASCPALRDGKCSGKKGPDGKEMSGACLQPIEIPLGSRVMIAG
ncbi:MAG: hypothetical protein FJ135_15315, partial [Deltaproteobacteria bacterium]|nr:hypothetical protein [Deltaproteobacteria bacterium]